jgi:hypothetical protein
MLPVNDNTINLARYKGRVLRCPHCAIKNTAKVDAVVFERLSMGKSCPICFNQGFVAECVNCQSTGIYKGSAVAFGGSDTPHQSTCNACGGNGYFAVKQPADWTDDPAPTTSTVPSPAISA